MKLAATKIWKMDSEPTEERGESTEQSAQEQTSQKIPLSKLRDLRPEKDPIGAGHQRAANSSSHFLR